MPNHTGTVPLLAPTRNNGADLVEHIVTCQAKVGERSNGDHTSDREKSACKDPGARVHTSFPSISLSYDQNTNSHTQTMAGFKFS
jgi:hypothetical protein